MRILMIHHRLPFPLHSGMDKVSYNLFRTLSQAHQITLITPIFEHTTPEAVDQCTRLVDRLITVPVKSHLVAMKRNKFWSIWRLIRLMIGIPGMISENDYLAVSEHIQHELQHHKYDLVQAVSLDSAHYLRLADNFQTSVIFHDNSFQQRKDYMIHSRSPLARWMRWLEYCAFLKYEPRIFTNTDWVFFLSQENLTQMQALARTSKYARVLKLAVETENETENKLSLIPPPIQQEANNLVFVGGLGSIFNQDAVSFFCSEIFPLILQDVPEACLYIVGQSPNQEMRKLEKPGKIILTGAVADVKPYIQRATVYVAPLRFGGGLKTKMVEAFSQGKAIVATPAALSGLWEQNQDALMIRKLPNEFATAVVNLLQNQALRKKMELAARALYEKAYSFPAVLPETLAAYAEIEREISHPKKRMRT